jgi:hypothetical protein
MTMITRFTVAAALFATATAACSAAPDEPTGDGTQL